MRRLWLATNERNSSQPSQTVMMDPNNFDTDPDTDQAFCFLSGDPDPGVIYNTNLDPDSDISHNYPIITSYILTPWCPTSKDKYNC